MSATPDTTNSSGKRHAAVAIDGPLRPGDELREVATGARIVLTSYLGTADSWRFRNGDESAEGDLTRHQGLPTTLLRERFERVTV